MHVFDWINGCMSLFQAPAGGCLVDACCLTRLSGDLCIAAAGKWAVCLWSQTSAYDWSLTHTWAFNEVRMGLFLPFYTSEPGVNKLFTP